MPNLQARGLGISMILSLLRRIFGVAVFAKARAIRGDYSNGKKDTMWGDYFHKE